MSLNVLSVETTELKPEIYWLSQAANNESVPYIETSSFTDFLLATDPCEEFVTFVLLSKYLPNLRHADLYIFSNVCLFSCSNSGVKPNSESMPGLYTIGRNCSN